MAFGDDGFASSDSKVGSRGRGNRGGGRGGNRARPNRNRNKNQGGGKNNPFGGGGTNVITDPIIDDPFDLTDVGDGNPFDSNLDPGSSDGGGYIDTGEGSESSGNDDNYRDVAWGLFNDAGMAADPIFGGAGADWLDNQIDDWYAQWKGENWVDGNPITDTTQPWDQYLYGIPGTAPPGGDPAVGADWNQMANWRRDQWGPDMRKFASDRFNAQTAAGRGYQSSRWVGPKRTITF